MNDPDPRAVLAYLGDLVVTQGQGAGERLVILGWQARFVRGLVRFGVGSAALTIARGGGKTTLLAGVAAACLDGPLAVPRGEAVLVASSFEQARIAFEHVLGFMSPTLEADRALPFRDRRWRVWDTAQQARIEDKVTGARVRCVGSDPRRAHGLAPTLVLADEPAQWPETTGEKMVAALRTAAGKQPSSRFVAVGTRPASSDHWFGKMLSGGADYVQRHEAREGDPPFQRRTWRRANPSLDHMPHLEAAIRLEADAARRDPAVFASFASLRLNLGQSDIEEQLLLSAGLWSSIEGTAAPSGPTCWGVDLGSTAAQSAIACYWPETGRLECVAAFPELPGLAERGVRDGVVGLYEECHRRGELLLLGRRSTDVAGLLGSALDRWGKPAVLVADRWREGELRDACEAAKVPAAALVTRGMGFKDGAEDVRAFRRACAEGRVVPIPTLLLRSAMSEARTVSDPSANQKLAKATQGGRRARARDDAACAAVLAVAEAVRRVARKPQRRRRTALVG